MEHKTQSFNYKEDIYSFTPEEVAKALLRQAGDDVHGGYDKRDVKVWVTTNEGEETFHMHLRTRIPF